MTMVRDALYVLLVLLALVLLLAMTGHPVHVG